MRYERRRAMHDRYAEAFGEVEWDKLECYPMWSHMWIIRTRLALRWINRAFRGHEMERECD